VRLVRRSDQYLRGRAVPPLPPPLGTKGGKKAATATAHTLIVIIWHVLAEATTYRDLGADYFTTRINSPDARKRRLIRELEALGHKVTIEPAAA
jgi:transposase